MTSVGAVSSLVSDISTHTPLTGRDAVFLMNALGIKFLLTRPLRDVTCHRWRGQNRVGISTHTPLTGRDQTAVEKVTPDLHFYSHAPYGT